MKQSCSVDIWDIQLRIGENYNYLSWPLQTHHKHKWRYTAPADLPPDHLCGSQHQVDVICQSVNAYKTQRVSSTLYDHDDIKNNPNCHVRLAYLLGGGTGAVVKTACLQSGDRRVVPRPDIQVLKKDFESCVWRAVSSIHLNILRRFSWPSLRLMCTKVAFHSFFHFAHQPFRPS